MLKSYNWNVLCNVTLLQCTVDSKYFHTTMKNEDTCKANIKLPPVGRYFNIQKNLNSNFIKYD